MPPIKFPTKHIFRNFYVLKINTMMSFCNLFMERPSYFSFISVVRRQHDKSQASQWNKWRKKLDSLKRCVRTKSLTRSKNQKGWFAAHCHDVNVLLSNSSLFGELFQERRHRLHGDRVHGRRNRGVQGVHVPPTFSGRGVQEGTLCESLCVSRCAVNGFVPF